MTLEGVSDFPGFAEQQKNVPDLAPVSITARVLGSLGNGAP
jgi:hypothetical protein